MGSTHSGDGIAQLTMTQNKTNHPPKLKQSAKGIGRKVFFTGNVMNRDIIT
jgi:hypothetical protein